eukprot:6095294-Pyramimonas_sp.AAC.1
MIEEDRFTAAALDGRLAVAPAAPSVPRQVREAAARALGGEGLRSGRRARRKMAKARGAQRGGALALEIFSQSKVSAELQRRGHSVSAPLDLVLGTDLLSPDGEARLWRQLREDQPLF